MEKTEAYRILGLPEDSGAEAVEQRYGLLMKKKMGPEETRRLNEAYRLIKYGTAEEPGGKGKVTFNGFGDRMAYLWEYYRWHAIGIIAGIFILVAIGNTVVQQVRSNAVKPDVTVMLYGNFPQIDTKTMQADLLKKHPGWKRVDVSETYMPTQLKSSYDAALAEKAMAVLAADQPDIFILDKTNFDKLLTQGAFANLDAIAARVKLPASRTVTGKADSSGGTHVYGIDVSGNPLWKALKLNAPQEIAVMDARAKHKANAEQLMMELAQGGA